MIYVRCALWVSSSLTFMFFGGKMWAFYDLLQHFWCSKFFSFRFVCHCLFSLISVCGCRNSGFRITMILICSKFVSFANYFRRNFRKTVNINSWNQWLSLLLGFPIVLNAHNDVYIQEICGTSRQIPRDFSLFLAETWLPGERVQDIYCLGENVFSECDAVMTASTRTAHRIFEDLLKWSVQFSDTFRLSWDETHTRLTSVHRS